jgi:predicted RNA-binding protein
LPYRVYVEKELSMDRVVNVKANSLGVALRDSRGATKVLDGVYVAEIDSLGGFITLRASGRGDRAR